MNSTSKSVYHDLWSRSPYRSIAKIASSQQEKITASAPSAPLSEKEQNRTMAKKHPLKSLRRLVKFRRKLSDGTVGPRQNQNQHSSPSNNNRVLKLLAESCPQDVVSHVLAFAGPQAAASLSRVNRHWKHVMDSEDTWRVLCMELCKWKPGDEVPSSSWKDYYRCNPCVPVDYRSISGALTAALDHTSPSVRVLVRPGRYEVSQPIQVPEVFAESSEKLQIIIEKMQLSPPLAEEWSKHNQNEVVLHSRRASIRHNQPLFRISRGKWTLKQICLQHYSDGLDLWRGNAAVHVDPSPAPGPNSDHGSLMMTDPQFRWPRYRNRRGTISVALDECQVTSTSGRGIVVLSEASQVNLTDSAVYGCAATGIYVGGNAALRLVRTNVTNNGMGARRSDDATSSSQGGNNGIQLGQGRALVVNSNIS